MDEDDTTCSTVGLVERWIGGAAGIIIIGSCATTAVAGGRSKADDVEEDGGPK